MKFQLNSNSVYRCCQLESKNPLNVKLLDQAGKTDLSLANFTNAEQLANKSTIMDNSFIKVDKRDFNGYGSAMVRLDTNEGYQLVETPLSRYITACLRFNHLIYLTKELDKQPGYNSLARRKMSENIDSLKQIIRQLAEQSALSAQFIRSIVNIVGSKISYTTTNLNTTFITSMLLRSGYTSSVISLDDSILSKTLNFARVDGYNSGGDLLSVESKENLKLNSNLSSLVIDVNKRYNLSIKRDILSRVLENIKNFSTCSDLLFELVLFKDEFSTSESFMRGLTFMKNFEKLDASLGNSSITKFDFITNFNELFELCTGRSLKTQIVVNDISFHSIQDAKSGNIYTLTALQLISLLGHPATKRGQNEINFGDFSFKITDSIKSLVNLPQADLLDIIDIIWTVTAVAHGVVSKINFDESSIEIDLAKFISVVDRNFSC